MYQIQKSIIICINIEFHSQAVQNYVQTPQVKMRYFDNIPVPTEFQHGGNTGSNASKSKNDMTDMLESFANQLMNNQQEATTQQQKIQQTEVAQMKLLQQQMRIQQGTAAATI